MKFAIIDGDWRPTVREVAEKYGVSETTVHDISRFEMIFFCARQIPRLLTPENLEKRVELSRQFIKKITRDIFFGQHCQN